MNAREYYLTVKEDRLAWRESMPQRCMYCGSNFWPVGCIHLWPEVHEILSRAHAPNSWGFRANYLLLDSTCHAKVAALSHAEQLAIKLRCDPDHYDLREWLIRRNIRAMEYVTQDEVDRFLQRRIA